MNLLLFMLIDNSDRILEILSDLDFFGLIQASMPRDTRHHQRREAVKEVRKAIASVRLAVSLCVCTHLLVPCA